MRGRTIETQPTYAALSSLNRKKTISIKYNNDTENYSIEQRTTVNLTSLRAGHKLERNRDLLISQLQIGSASANSGSGLATIPTLTQKEVD